MLILVALGGNALLRRGEAMTAENQRRNAQRAALALAPIAREHQLVITHGNGPQVGLLALQAAAVGGAESWPLDVLGAESEGMIGYLIEQELGNVLHPDAPIATVLCMVEVDLKDPAFQHPTKPIGPVYTPEEGAKVAQEKGWKMVADGKGVRRVVASPLPRRIFQLRPIRWLLDKGVVVIAAGGGGIPTAFDAEERLRGVEAVVDKDRASALLARQLGADLFVMATDVHGVYQDWGKPEARAVRAASPDALTSMADFAAGSMGPKVESAAEFARLTGKPACIGALEDIDRIVLGEAGTRVTTDASGLEYYTR